MLSQHQYAHCRHWVCLYLPPPYVDSFDACKYIEGSQRVQQLRALVAFAQDLNSVPSTSWQLPAACNSSSRLLDAFFHWYQGHISVSPCVDNFCQIFCICTNLCLLSSGLWESISPPNSPTATLQFSFS